MAIRTKTIEYAFPLSTASLSSGTARDFTTLAALAIPETTGRTFRSVTLEVSAVDNATSAASLTAVLIGIALGAVARNDVTVTQTLVNTGENQTFLFSRDVTSYFATNYTGTSMTAGCRLTITGIETSNATAKLIITYEYDDAATTHIKTVKIPIDGNTGNLTTSFTNVGGVANQMPALDTFLPEDSKVYRDIFFEMNCHTGTTAAANQVLNMRYDGTTTVADLSHAHTLVSDVLRRRIDKLLGITTNVAHSIEANTTSVTGAPYPCLNGVLVVTYEFNASTSTTILNSIQVATMDESGWCGGTTTGDKSRYVHHVSVQEPATITLVQSGVLLSCIDFGAVSLDFRAGAQASRVFVHPNSAHCGGMTSMRRIDAGAVGGAGLTLARGFNAITLDWFTTSAAAGNLGSNMSGVLYLNYTSGKHANGVGVHAQTRHWLIRPYATGNLVQRLQAAGTITPTIPESTYWLDGVSYLLIGANTSTFVSGALAFAFQAEIQAGEETGAGWRALYSALYSSDAESAVILNYCRTRTAFRRWPSDPETSRLDVETARDYRYDCNVDASMVWQAALSLTYHTITYAIAGQVTGSGGGTVQISAHLAVEAGTMPKGLEIATTSRVGDGAYSLTWYDNTVSVFVEARESASLLGRSDDGVAV